MVELMTLQAHGQLRNLWFSVWQS